MPGNNNNSAWRTFKFISLQQISGLKYCNFGNVGNNLNLTNILRNICYDNEICCDIGNGCCPVRSSRYYESRFFWIFICGVMLACYVLCWYCKKLEKERQANARANALHDRNQPRILPCLRPVNANSVDHLLERLILNYRRNLMSEQHQPVQNVDEIKVAANLNLLEPPPEYTDAVKMPKPNQPILEDSSISSNESMRNHADEEPDNSITLDIEEEAIPSYEEAIKKI